MTKVSEAASPVTSVKERIIIALDVDSKDDARSLIEELNSEVGAFKIGLQLFAAAGPEFVREQSAAGRKIFLDLKFHDIPNTVAKVAIEVARLGVWMFNVHASGGGEMMRRTVDAVNDASAKENLQKPLVIGVTVLTSSDDATLNELGVDAGAREQTLRLASLAKKSGLDGVVASPQDVADIRSSISENFLTVTPGIRSLSATGDDQKRVTSLGQAIAAGSDYVVIGRPVTQAPDRRKALQTMIEEASNN